MATKTFVTLFACALLQYTCYGIASADYQVSHCDALINRTYNIVLARVVLARFMGGANCEVMYELEPVQVLRGNQKDRFSITGEYLRSADDLRSFIGHSDTNFWHNAWGRILPDEDRIIHPRFSVGRYYLIFLDKPYHVKSFEQVSFSPEADKWYVYVKQKVDEQKDSEENIRYRAGMRLVSELAHDVNKLNPSIHRGKLLQYGLIYVAEHPKITNSDIEAYMHDPQVQSKCRIVDEVAHDQSTLTTNPPPWGAEGSGGSEDSNP